MRVDKIIVLLVFLILIALLPACRSISKEDAVSITKAFVDKQVKPYVNEENSSQIISRAKVTILNTEKKNNNWNVYLNMKSNQTGDIKQANLIIEIDGKTGDILNIKKYGKN
ncbi:hypothetical protein GF323_01965 [Candidatus Woesearchaeota archaeon]|nr:hypothetical protein [Candidatus Woesearchaeota archaeon]